MWQYCVAIAIALSCVVHPIASTAAPAPAPDLAAAWYETTRCNEASMTTACMHYERCKATHRCARGEEDYSIKAATLASFTRQFADGNRSRIALMNDFEDWKTGTHDWKFRPDANATSLATVGWDSFSFNVIGSLELASGHLIFDTDKAEVRGDVVLRGVFATTRDGTNVAVFNFLTVFIGSNVRVRFIGRVAISILSRSSMLIDTTLDIRPGTLGGFAGGGFIGTSATNNNNRNGPGSSSVRVFVKTVSTSGTHIPEIQEIETSAAPGQKLQGHFVLFYGENSEAQTQPIAYDATSYDVQLALESAFHDIGTLHVERDDTLVQVAESGRLWRVTFVTAVGNAPQLRAKSFLHALAAKVETRTMRDGNALSGTFQLGFRNRKTRALAHDVAADAMRVALLEDLPFLVDARVARTDPQAQCVQGSTLPDQRASRLTPLTPTSAADRSDLSDWLVPHEPLVDSVDSVKSTRDKLCASGRGAADGFVWRIQFWTREGNVMPTSPTSPIAAVVDAAAPLIVASNDLVGIGATVETVDSLAFSLAFGGAGASFASKGGSGYAPQYREPLTYAPVYANEFLTDLLGGSGGAGGGNEPIDVFPVMQPTLGGAGAGALLLSAVNDVVIGLHGRVVVSGGRGQHGFTAGGGGSGGSLLVISGGAISHHGAIEAIGGHGGSSSSNGFSGGGGSGGRVALYAQSFSTWGDGSIVASGGASQDPLRVGGHGSVYIHVQSDVAIRVDPTLGAAGSRKSLLVHGSERYDSRATTSSTTSLVAPRSGPRFVLDAAVARPTRVAFFVRVDNFAVGTITTNRGAIFSLYDRTSDSIDDKDAAFMISTAIVDGSFTHEANAFAWPRQPFQHKIQAKRWYKLDLLINWDEHTYAIQLNDVLKVQHARFTGDRVYAISLSNHHSMSTWWDEIYVGDDHLLGFACPYIVNAVPHASADGADAGNGDRIVAIKRRALRTLWATPTYNESTTFHPMTTHASHLSQREEFQHNHGGMVPRDGAPHRAFFNDVHDQATDARSSSNKADLEEDIVMQAEMLVVPALRQDSSIVWPLETGVDVETRAADRTGNDAPIESKRASMYWYSEVFNASTPINTGGIGACSTLDYVEWRNEGIMVHFVNLTDPFSQASSNLIATRPKVLFNAQTQRFVMWMHVDNASSNAMGLSGVATSTFPNGPFTFTRSMYPDGAPVESPGGQSIHETRDFTLAIVSARDDDATAPQAYLLRAYYKTVEYWLPRAVMDPLWQSVQKDTIDEDDRSSSTPTTTDFGLSYHRAFYHSGYDDPNDIYLQRWRMEDVAWTVVCCDPTDMTICLSNSDIPSTPSAICPAGLVKREIHGQSQMTDNNTKHLTTRYKDPSDDRNSAFRPASVATHTPWGFPVTNSKTWRGTYLDALSTNITQFVFLRFATAQYEQKDDPLDDALVSAATAVIYTNDSHVVSSLLGTLGIPIPPAFQAKYSSFDLLELDVNSDNKITQSEIAALERKRTLQQLPHALVDALLTDIATLKQAQMRVLDPNQDGAITYTEFEHWLGVDVNVLFDQFDIDKSGFLDEFELARLLSNRQLPRLDELHILLDPSFDGRVSYERFRSLLRDVPDMLFSLYDTDKSESLESDEIELLLQDIGPAFADARVLNALTTSNTTANGLVERSITRADYVQWFSATTSLVVDAHNALKIDNAVHATRPDSRTGPLHVVERRRAKFLAISRLTSDYETTEGLLREVEGGFDGDGNDGGSEALVHYFALTEQLFGLSADSDDHTDAWNAFSSTEDAMPLLAPFRHVLTADTLGDSATYWNGRHWEARQAAPSVFTYGRTCLAVAGLAAAAVDDGRSASDSGCLPCAVRSPFTSSLVDSFQSLARNSAHCATPHDQVALDAYVKAFDQHVSIQLQHQQQSVTGPQGLQPHLSPCFNQSQFYPCDVHKVLDGTIGDDTGDASTRRLHARDTAWHVAYEAHAHNSSHRSIKIRAASGQRESIGPSFIERFPHRIRGPLASQLLDVQVTSSPDQLADVMGGGS